MFGLLGLDDPKAEKIKEKYDNTAASLWKASNSLWRVSILCSVIAVCLIVAAVILPWLLDASSQIPTQYSESTLSLTIRTFLPTLALLVIILGGILWSLYMLSVLVLAVIMKEYLFAVGIFFISPLAFIFKYLKGKEL